MSNEQKTTNNSGFVAFLLFIALFVSLGYGAQKLGRGDFDQPDLKVGDCVVIYKIEDRKLESWESNAIKEVIKIEEVGSENYRVTFYYIFYKKSQYMRIEQHESTYRFNWLDDEQKVDCQQAMSVMWDQNS